MCPGKTKSIPLTSHTKEPSQPLGHMPVVVGEEGAAEEGYQGSKQGGVLR